MMGGSRYRTKARARETEDAVAEFLANAGWPDAQRPAAFLAGPDTLRVPGLRLEIKARRDLRLTTWLEQASPKRLTTAEVYIGAVPAELPFVVHRPDGWGPARVGIWPASMRLEHLAALLRLAGYNSEGPPARLEDGDYR
jgi:hypothetical protein